MAGKFKDLFSRKPGSVQPGADTCFQRGNAHVSRQEWQLALDCYREAVRVNPYQAAIALNPDYPEAYCNLGHAQQETGQGDAALDSYSRALEINPRLSTVFSNRGNLFRSRHEYAKALLD